jgi:hypothetical protein
MAKTSNSRDRRLKPNATRSNFKLSLSLTISANAQPHAN